MISDTLFVNCLIALMLFTLSWLLRVIICRLLGKFIIPSMIKKEKKLTREILALDYLQGVKKKNETKMGR